MKYIKHIKKLMLLGALITVPGTFVFAAADDNCDADANLPTAASRVSAHRQIITRFSALHPGKDVAGGNFYFVENKGQIRDQYGNVRADIDFRLAGKGVQIFVGDGQIHYQFSRQISSFPGGEDLDRDMVAIMDEDSRFAIHRMDVRLVGANAQARLQTGAAADYFERYYNHHKEQDGLTAQAYQKIIYEEVYPHIDWVLYVNNGMLEYDFIVRPGGKVSDIRLEFQGADRLKINKDGSLSAVTPLGSVREQKPYSYQTGGATVPSRFKIKGNELMFDVAPYEGTLTIDPLVRAWGTYYGGDGTDDILMGILVDDGGNVYVTGRANGTTSLNIATAGSHQDTLSGTTDAILVKFDRAGVRQWATYYGGDKREYGWALAKDEHGDIYMSGGLNGSASGVGSTWGIATTGSHQDTLGGKDDIFLVKFNQHGVRQWATYYGGEEKEEWRNAYVVCDQQGGVYLAGSTLSTTGIATPGAYRTSFTGTGTNYDAFLVKFNTDGIRQWGTYFGGAKRDVCEDVACDDAGNVYIAGVTESETGIATSTSHQGTLGGSQDAFLAKFSGNGVLQWATYYGGAQSDAAEGVACDQHGNVFIGGGTSSATGIATAGVHQDTLTISGSSGKDMFLAKFNSAGVRQWGTYYGTEAYDDECHSVTCDIFGDVYIGGYTSGTTGVAVPGTYRDTIAGAQDACLGKFSSQNGVLMEGTYYGGSSAEQGGILFCDRWGNLYLTGMTMSPDGIASSGAHQDTQGTGGFLLIDAYLVKFGCIIDPVGIAVDSFTLSTTQGYHTYQWYREGVLIPGATDSSYTVGENGWFSVKVTTPVGCSDSTSYQINNVSVIDLNLSAVEVYPNPANKVVHVNLNKPGRLILTGMDGRQLYVRDVTKGVSGIDIAHLPAGIYLLSVSDEQGVMVRNEKLIKTEK